MKLDWGWRRGEYKGIYERLTKDAQCFATFGERHEEVASIMRNRPSQSEERRASQVFYVSYHIFNLKPLRPLELKRGCPETLCNDNLGICSCTRRISVALFWDILFSPLGAELLL